MMHETKLRETPILHVGTPIFEASVNYDFDPRPYLVVEKVDISDRTISVYLSYTNDAAKNIREIYGQPSFVVVGAEVDYQILEQKYTVNFFLQNLDFNESFQIVNEKNIFDGNTRYYLATSPEFRKHVRNKTSEVTPGKNQITFRKFEHILKGALQWQVFLVDNELISNSHYQHIVHHLNKIDEINETARQEVFQTLKKLQGDWKNIVLNLIDIVSRSTMEMKAYKDVYDISLKVLFTNTVDIDDKHQLLRNFILETFDVDEYEERQNKMRNIIQTKKKPVIVPSKRYFNILVLGLEGAGKQTFINCLANYLKYNTIYEAKENPQVLIPTEFYLNYEKREIRIRASATINVEEDDNPCKKYTLVTEHNVYTFINTPSFLADEKKNTKNSKRIYKFINNIKIDAVCILMKADDTSSDSPAFTSLVKEITNINDTICKNAMICFTHANSTSFKGGHSLSLLVENVKGVDTQFFKTFYCFDNESFTYLLSHKEVAYNEEYVKAIENCWNKSWTETNRLLKDITLLNN